MSASPILASMEACATTFPEVFSSVSAPTDILGYNVRVRLVSRIRARQIIPWNAIPRNREGGFNVYAKVDSLERDVKSILMNVALSLA
jgi:hypothetical protein